MKNNLLSFRNATKIFTLVGLLALGACNSAPDVDKTKESLNTGTPSTAPGLTTTEASPTVNSTTATNPQTPVVSPENATSITFAESTHDFGTVKEGESVTHVFKFKNSGAKPLTIFDAKGSCGCTVPEYPKEPIAPGATGEIKVVFNSKGKKGLETKYVTLNANTEPAETRLTIKANVLAADVKTK